MSCPACGYLLQPWETECPRCVRLNRAKAPVPVPVDAAASPQTGTTPPVPPPDIAASPLPPVAPSPSDTAPTPSKQMWLLTTLSIANARLLVLVAVLSVACIYLSGIVIGRKIEANREAEIPLPPRPAVRQQIVTPVSTPMPTMNHAPLLLPPARNTQDIETFLAFVGKLEAAKRVLLQARRQQESAYSGWNNSNAFFMPHRLRRIGAASPPQLKLEWERWLQLRQDLNRIPCPTPCFKLYGAYQNYLLRVEQAYSELDRLTGTERGNQPDPETSLTNLYNAEPALIQQAAAEANRELRNVCLSNSLPKTFTIE